MAWVERAVAFSDILCIEESISQVGEIVICLVRHLIDPQNDQLFSIEGDNNVDSKGIISPYKVAPIMQNVYCKCN